MAPSRSRQGLFGYAQSREYHARPYSSTKEQEHARRRGHGRMCCSLREEQLTLPDVDKVFTATWLSDSEVLCGTKCNKVRRFNFFFTIFFVLRHGFMCSLFCGM
eukprot:Colp12_sorted_trinity150504_noHs@16423